MIKTSWEDIDMTELYAKIRDFENIVCANKNKINIKTRTQNVQMKENDLEK